MNFPKFEIFIVCIGYSKNLEACLYYWSHMKYSNFRIHIITYIKDIETINVCKNYSDINIIIYNEKDYHHKGKMLEYGMQNVKDIGDYIFFSDADIIFDSSLLLKCTNLIAEKEDIIISSIREGIHKIDLDLFFSNYKKYQIGWVWENITKDIIMPSSFMGWFTIFPSKYLAKLDFHTRHKGYDIIDWKITQQLSFFGLKKILLHMDNYPLHIYHGNKGANWKGVNIN